MSSDDHQDRRTTATVHIVAISQTANSSPQPTLVSLCQFCVRRAEVIAVRTLTAERDRCPNALSVTKPRFSPKGITLKCSRTEPELRILFSTNQNARVSQPLIGDARLVHLSWLCRMGI